MEKYHDWKVDKNQIICANCKKNALEILHDEKNSNNVRKQFNDIVSENLAEKICLFDGLLHTFEVTESGDDVCQKCKKSREYKYTESEKKEIFELVLKVNNDKERKLMENESGITEFYDKKVNYINTAVNKLKDEFNKDKKSGMDFLVNLTEEIQKNIGNEFVGFNLTENLYIIDHDHIGNSLDKNIVILESQQKIIKKENHPFFKTNIIYYTNYKYGKIDVFYDATTKILLGYKEENKNFIMNKKHDRKIKLNYSVLNKIKLLGYKTSFIKTDILYEKIMTNREIINTDKKIISNIIIESIINERIAQLKKVILNLKIILSRILNNHIDEITPDEYNKFKFNQLTEKYRKKMVNITLNDKSGNNSIFKHWKAIVNGTNIIGLENLKLEYDFSKQKEINFEEINKIDIGGNLLTYFLHKEFMKFFEYNNDNKILKTTISNFIVDYINLIFDIFNNEKDNSNVEIKRFTYLLSSSTHIEEIEEKSGVQNLEGIYSEYQNPDEEKTPEEITQKEEADYDLIQENETFDVDIDKDDIMEEGEERMTEFEHLQRVVEPIDIYV